MSNNTADSIKCPVCLTPFDADKHIPKISPTCGHTVCKDCLIQVLKMDMPKCPLDKLKFGKDFRSIDSFPTNFLGKDLLEMEGKWGVCESHQEQQKMICLTDHTLVCGNCVVFGEHKGHNIKKLSAFEEIINQKKNELSSIAERVSKISSEFTNALDEKKESLKKIITNRFQILRSEITKQEIGMLMEVESVFKDENKKLSSMISASLEMPFDIQAKLKEFYNGMSNPNIVKLVEEDFSGLEKMLEEKLAPFRTKHTEEIAELLAVFQDNLPSEDFLKDFNILEPLNKALDKLILEKRVPEEEETKEITLLPVKLKIHQESENESWTLKIKDSENKEFYTFLKTDLERISKISYDFKFTKETISSTDLAMIKLFSKSLKNLKTVHLKIEPEHTDFKNLCDARFFYLISSIFSQLDDGIERINIEVDNADIKDCGLVYLAEAVLPRFKKIKNLSFDLQVTRTTSKTLKALDKIEFSKFSDLRKFHLNLTHCPLEEDVVAEFLKRVPNVKDLLIGFGGAPITDKAMDYFSTNTLISLDKVENLEIGLWETKVTNEGVQKLLSNIPNVKILALDFMDTKIEDASVKEFVANKLITLTDLQKFQLNLRNTLISKDLLHQIREWENKFSLNQSQEREAEDEDEEEEDNEEEEEEEGDDDEEDEDIY